MRKSMGSYLRKMHTGIKEYPGQEVDGAMKVQNTTIFMGDVLGNNDRSQGLSGNSQEKGGRQSIFAGDLSQNFDPIAQKQQSARKKVMKIVGDAWASDQTLDDELVNARTRMEESKKAMGEANKEIKWAEDERAALRESYGVEADSQEEQDLKLLEKEHTARTFGGVSLSEEERERLAQIHEEGLTEYQQRSMELYEGEDYYKKQLNEAKGQMKAANDSVSSIKSAQAKSKTMLKAQDTTEQIMEATRKEVIGMLVDEAKDHIDEEMEEKKEEALEKAEKEKEEEERIEKAKEEKEEKEEFTEQVADSTQLLTEADSAMEEAQRAIKKVMEEMKLLEEDIKGAAVDASM